MSDRKLNQSQEEAMNVLYAGRFGSAPSTPVAKPSALTSVPSHPLPDATGKTAPFKVEPSKPKE